MKRLLLTTILAILTVTVNNTRAQEPLRPYASFTFETEYAHTYHSGKMEGYIGYTSLISCHLNRLSAGIGMDTSAANYESFDPYAVYLFQRIGYTFGGPKATVTPFVDFGYYCNGGHGQFDLPYHRWMPCIGVNGNIRIWENLYASMTTRFSTDIHTVIKNTVSAGITIKFKEKTDN